MSSKWTLLIYFSLINVHFFVKITCNKGFPFYAKTSSFKKKGQFFYMRDQDGPIQYNHRQSKA
jgi:hypothetical protein